MGRIKYEYLDEFNECPQPNLSKFNIVISVMGGPMAMMLKSSVIDEEYRNLRDRILVFSQTGEKVDTLNLYEIDGIDLENHPKTWVTL